MAKQSIIGYAREVNQRLEVVHPLLQYYVLSFRVEGAESEGQTLPPFTVEIHGPTNPRAARPVKGTLRDGDKVEVLGALNPGKSLKVKRIRNLTDDSTVG